MYFTQVDILSEQKWFERYLTIPFSKELCTGTHLSGGSVTETPPVNAGAPGPVLQLRPGANKSILKKKQNKLCTYVILMTCN